jgi:hypothetical protein
MCSAHPLFNPNLFRSNDGQRVSMFFISLFFATPIWQKKLTAGSCRCRELMPIGDRVRIYFCTRTNLTSFWGKGRNLPFVSLVGISGSEGWVVHTRVGRFLGSTRNCWFWFLKSLEGSVWGFFFSFLMNWNLIFSYDFRRENFKPDFITSFQIGPLFQVLKSGSEFSWKNLSCWHIWFSSQYANNLEIWNLFSNWTDFGSRFHKWWFRFQYAKQHHKFNFLFDNKSITNDWNFRFN